jgi:phospholipid-transporting ATPase
MTADVSSNKKKDEKKPKTKTFASYQEDDDEIELSAKSNDAGDSGNQSSGRMIKIAVANNSLPSNAITSSKNTLLNFLPKNLYKQFRKIEYIFFCVVIILQALPFTSISEGFPHAAIVLGFSVVMGIVKDLVEDFRRYRLDQIENKFQTRILQGSKEVEVNWADVRPGNIVKVKKDEEVPADCVFLFGSNVQKEMCQLETRDVDGQCNLVAKKRLNSKEEIQQTSPLDYLSNFVNSKLTFDPPDHNLNNFKGSLELVGNSVALDIHNLILRKSVLRNTEFIYAVVIYTGNDTKVMMRELSIREKTSELETFNDRIMLVTIVFALCISVFAAVYFIVYLFVFKSQMESFVNFDALNPFALFLSKFVNWVLIV